MKKIIAFVGIIFICSHTSMAEDFIKTPVQDFMPTQGMDYVYEIKTTKFDQVILDCQSFITGINFIRDNQSVSNVYLDMFMCEEMVQYLLESKRENLPVCIGLDSQYNELTITREEGEDCN